MGDPCAVLLPSILPFDMYMSGTRRRSGRAPEMQFANQFSLCLFLADTLNLIVILIWNDTTHVQILFINWLRVVVWCCSFLCLFVCLFAKYALRVPPAVTRLTVYRRLRVITQLLFGTKLGRISKNDIFLSQKRVPGLRK